MFKKIVPATPEGHMFKKILPAAPEGHMFKKKSPAAQEGHMFKKISPAAPEEPQGSNIKANSKISCFPPKTFKTSKKNHPAKTAE